MTKKANPTGDRKIKKETIVFDASARDYLMRSNGCSIGFNMPKALEGEDTFGLPPYRKRMPYLVDKFPACPQEWLRSEGKVKSYFVPVIEGDGMWLDFNNNNSNTHHLAIVVSVQGINPITGLPCNDAQLEQYIEKCPKHKIKFGADRYCKECGYKWPKQNYICTTGTPNGSLWLDGFRASDGLVRQYILTAEKMRGVASNVIGNDRVYAIGISFFLSKEKKPVSTTTYGTRGVVLDSFDIPKAEFYPNWTYINNGTSGGCYGDNVINDFYSTCDSLGLSKCSVSSSHAIASNSSETKGVVKLGKISKKNSYLRSRALVETYHYAPTSNVTPIKQTKKLEVGAGAKINQSVYDDPEKLDFWHSDPESIICINYCDEEEVRKIVESGTIDVEGSKEGFLQDIPVGN